MANAGGCIYKLQSLAATLRFGQLESVIYGKAKIEMTAIRNYFDVNEIDYTVESQNGFENLVVTPNRRSIINRFALKNYSTFRQMKTVVSPTIFVVFPQAGSAYNGGLVELPFSKSIDKEGEWIDSGIPKHSFIFSRLQVENFDERSPLVRHELDHAQKSLDLLDGKFSSFQIRGSSRNQEARNFFYSSRYTSEETLIILNDLIHAKEEVIKLGAARYEGLANDPSILERGALFHLTKVDQFTLALQAKAYSGFLMSIQGIAVSEDLGSMLSRGERPQFLRAAGRTWGRIFVSGLEHGREYEILVPLPNSQGVKDDRNLDTFAREVQKHWQINHDLGQFFGWVYNKITFFFEKDPAVANLFPSFLRSLQIPVEPGQRNYGPVDEEKLDNRMRQMR